MKKILGLLGFILCQISYAQQEPLPYSSFMPEVGKYIVSGWVKELHPLSDQVMNYDQGSIKIELLDSAGTLLNDYSFLPQGPIIDGWQRILGIIEIDATHQFINISLNNLSSDIQVCFDDIRFLPYDGNMKSFVYDIQTLRLMAELDENNYASFYEYDSEGGLVRVKKETERGVFTIKETRSSTMKVNNDSSNPKK